MARYVAVVDSPLSVEEAFASLADLRRFAEWDPGVASSVQVTPSADSHDGPGLGATYDLTLAPPSAPLRLRYRVIEFDPPNRIVVEAANRLLCSYDTISVAASATGSLVVYDAELRLPFPLALADPVLGPVFNVIGDRAATGLRRFLESDHAEDDAVVRPVADESGATLGRSS